MVQGIPDREILSRMCHHDHHQISIFNFFAEALFFLKKFNDPSIISEFLSMNFQWYIDQSEELDKGAFFIKCPDP